ncbi:MAG: nitrate ABC transporter permease [Pirellulaceae bacterium]|nr:MAG: nitrate ABC transporter permease [Pirellulaceae bacterium]
MRLRNGMLRFCEIAGLPILEPVVRLVFREDPRAQLVKLMQYVAVPAVALAVFLVLWSWAARVVVTDSVQLPGPAATWKAGRDLFALHFQQRQADRQAVQQRMREALVLVAKAQGLRQLCAQRPEGITAPEKCEQLADQLEQRALQIANAPIVRAPTFIDQIVISLQTVFFGFLLATAIAVPVGILCGMNPWISAALTPFIQLFKPVSPLAWLPLAAVVVIWAYGDTAPHQAMFQKSFLISASTVALCSLWPTLVNTTLGVASVPKDFLNVGRVLKLSPWQRLVKILLPASLPLMFTGLRISLGVGWMVLIAADMLAQNPGLGKFVWDEFQNGSSLTYARITFSVLTIGVIGLLLDRLMVCLQNLAAGRAQLAT